MCRQPVFHKGASATDQSLNVAGRRIVTENNYGYSGPQATEQGRTTTPGIERVDVKRDLSGCRKVWTSNEIAPTVVPKISLANGLVYAYTKPRSNDGSDYWYFTALDLATGRTVYRFRAGEGLGYNNNYAPITIGPDDGSVYIGVLGGLVRLNDAVPPPRPGGGPKGKPRLSLTLKYGAKRLRRAREDSSRPCAAGPVEARVSGPDAHLIATVDFLVGSRRVGRDVQPPYVRTLRLARGSRDRVYAIGSRVRLVDGRGRTLHKSVTACAEDSDG